MAFISAAHESRARLLTLKQMLIAHPVPNILQGEIHWQTVMRVPSKVECRHDSPSKVAQEARTQYV